VVDFALSDENRLVQQSARAFAETEILPHIREWDEKGEVHREVFARMGEQGFLGAPLPEKYGGGGMDYISFALLCEELERADTAFRVVQSVHVGLNSLALLQWATEEQRQRWLVPAIKGEKVAALAITEPGAGSDVAGIKTFARREGGGYVVNGSKTFITNGVRADLYVTAVKTTQEGGHQGLSFVVLEKGMEGFTVSRKLEKLGWHASDTGELSFQDVEVPEENLLGEENKGFYQIMSNFQWERLSMALGAVGGMQATFERTLDYAKERHAFGRAIGSFQAIRHKLAWMATEIEAARDFTYHALRLFLSGQDALKEVSIAKLYACRAAVRVADEAVQIHGGYGYMREYDVERALRDARLGPIGGGSDEIMKEIIGKQLGL
jgi:acyl-CoA dehydrogenase